MIGLNDVYVGDCREIMKYIPDKSIDMILCDLPYGMTKNSWDTILPFVDLWGHYERIIKANGAIVLNSCQPFTTLLIHSNIPLFRYTYVWIKSKAGNFLTAGSVPLRYHEDICVFYKSPPTYNHGAHKLVVPVHSGRKNKTGSCYKDFKLDINYQQKFGGYNRSVLEFANPSGKGHLHPSAKPVALYEHLIGVYTNQNDVVLDNCAGSGTTAVACINTNRNYILIEQEPKYADICRQRISEARMK